MKRWKHKSVLNLIKSSGNPDPIDEIRNRARNVVLEALEQGWEGPPYNPIQLSKILGIEITPNDAVKDALIIPVSDKEFQIQYNPYQKQTRINFSIAHEIGHALFPDCDEDIRNREDEPTENRELERLCNIAAAEIQLPYGIFSNDANSVPVSLESLIELATRYKASLESTMLRYVEVVDKPCAILIGIFVEVNKIVIDYHKASRYFKLKLPENISVPQNSKIYECTAPGWSSRETSNWQIFGAGHYNIYGIGISAYKKDNKQRVAILVVPKDESNDNELKKIVMEFGDATKPRGTGVKIIAQVVNTSGGLGIGFGKSLARNYPEVKEQLENWSKDKIKFQLGNSNLIRISKTLFIFQMLAQKGLYPKDNEIPLKYTALRKCLVELCSSAKELNASVHMPQIGSGQAQGNWELILGMIHDELVNKDINVNVYVLPGKSFNPTKKTNLTLFNEASTWETEK